MRPQKLYLCLYRTLLIIVSLEIIAGVLIFGLCEYTKLFLDDSIFQIEKHEALKVILIAKIYGLHVSLCFAGGIIVILLFKDIYTRHLRVCTILWILLSIETVIGSLFMAWLFIDTMKFVSVNFEESLKIGIKLYESDPQWVLLFDNLQYSYKCCGVYNHTDWTRINFSPEKEGDSTKLSKKLVMLPYSCARGNIPIKVEVNSGNVHMDGCFHVISNIIDDVNNISKVINGFIGCNVITILIMSRAVFMYTRVYSSEICLNNESEQLLHTTEENENIELKNRAKNKRELCQYQTIQSSYREND